MLQTLSTALRGGSRPVSVSQDARNDTLNVDLCSSFFSSKTDDILQPPEEKLVKETKDGKQLGVALPSSPPASASPAAEAVMSRWLLEEGCRRK